MNDDLSATTLGELIRETRGSIRTGPFGTTLRASEYSAHGVPVVSVGEVSYGAFRIHAETRRVGEGVLRRLPEYKLQVGDIVFGRKGAVDRSATVRLPQSGWFLGSDGIRVRLGDGVDQLFVGYALQRREARQWLLTNSTGTTMATLNQRALDGVPIVLPPIAEQHAIVAALDDISALLATLERLVAKKRDVKQGMMQELLAGRTRLPGFDGIWTVAPFRSIAVPTRERVMPQSIAGRVIELEHIGQGTGRLLGDQDAGESVSLKTRFRAGDVLFGKLRSYLRKYWLADREGYCSTEIWALRPQGGANSAWVRYLVEQEAFVEAASTAYGTHMPRADWNVVSRLEVGVPDSAEQAALAQVLLDADAEISALERRLEATRAIKQGMMQELLTGRTRLPVDKEVAA